MTDTDGLPSMDDTVEALGQLSKALETVERARGRLYDFHQLTGTADLQLREAVEALREAGHLELADRVDQELVGRNVLHGRWTFQVVEEYDDGYYRSFLDLEREVRESLGRPRHEYEAQLKASSVTPGRPGHELTPDS